MYAKLIAATLLLAGPIGVRAETTARAVDGTKAMLPSLRTSAVGQPFGVYDFEIDDGLYATITWESGLRTRPVRGEGRLLLSEIDGFAKPLPVRVAWQDGPAPLTVLLPGVTTRDDEPVVGLWMEHVLDAGHHVLTFDAVFAKGFTRRSRQGAAGNLRAEAACVGAVLEAFLRRPEAAGRVTEVNVVGLSYGGLVALHLASLAESGEAPVELNRVVAFSPPVSLRTSARLLDRYRQEDLARFGLLQLLPLKGHAPVEVGRPVPFTPELMRAGVGYAFRKPVRKAAKLNQHLYRRELARAGADPIRTKHVSFVELVEDVSYPYWAGRGSISSPDDLWRLGDLGSLLSECPASVHAVIADDDPLNDPDELQALVAAVPAARLTVLPRGGHVGYQRTDWVKRALVALINGNPIREQPVDAPRHPEDVARSIGSHGHDPRLAVTSAAR